MLHKIFDHLLFDLQSINMHIRVKSIVGQENLTDTFNNNNNNSKSNQTVEGGVVVLDSGQASNIIILLVLLSVMALITCRWYMRYTKKSPNFKKVKYVNNDFRNSLFLNFL